MDTAKLLQKLSSEGLRAYHVSYARFFDSVSDALLWEYFCQKVDTEGRVKISEADITHDLGLKRDALRGCRERLTARGVLSYTTVRGGVGKTETTYYVDQAKFAEQFVAWLEEGDETDSPELLPAPLPPPPPAEAAPPPMPQLSPAEAAALDLAAEWSGMSVQTSAPSLASCAPPAPAKGAESAKRPAKRGAARNAELFPLAAAIIEVTGSDRNVHMGQAMKVAAAIAKSEKATPTAILIAEKYGKGGWWYTADWRGKKGQLPTFWAIQQTWANWVGTEQDGASRVISGVTDEILRYGVPGFPGLPTV